MNDEQHSPEFSQASSPKIDDWARHAWDYLADIGETPRYAVVAGYIHKLLPRGHILDAGCGEGVLIDYLDLSRIKYSGFDVSPTAIDRARGRYDNAKVLSSPMETFTPLENEQYDIIIFNEVLAQVEGPIETLGRFSTFLRPSGHIIISQFQSPEPKAKGAVVTSLLEAEIAAGRLPLVAAAEVLNDDTGLRWKIYCLGGLQGSASGRPVRPFPQDTLIWATGHG